jgi:glutamate-5-semialdehyde dehydrogenase
MDLSTSMMALADRARAATRTLAAAGRAEKDRALLALAAALEEDAASGGASPLAVENARDLAEARAGGLDAAMLDRLALTPARIRAMAEGVRAIASFDDPIGSFVGLARRPNGLLVGRTRIPLGVIAIVYESRPNVTVDCAALTLKSGNAILLRGGKEAKHSNLALVELLRRALRDASLPEDAVQMVPPGDREEIKVLVGLGGKIDLVIPRGGEKLIRFVTEHARVPVIQHYQGVCHLFVDEGADHAMAERLVENGKLSRVGVCNALEGLLVDAKEAPTFLPRLARLIDLGLEIRGDEETVAALPGARAAAPADYGQEFLAKILAVRVVRGIDGALDHIARYGSNHTEVICTNHHGRAERFVREVDASCVLVNASSRFNDGGELGLGAEMGISTSKLHAYGPMGLEHLTTLKWVVYGDGQVR